MRITHQQCDADDDGCGDQRSHHRDKLHHSARRTKHQGIGNPGHFHEGQISDERKCRQHQLGADELRQHLIQIAQHAFQKFALRTGVHKREQDFAESARP